MIIDNTIALAGNPNCGKTTLFNELTGARQYVGNWAGVTVEKKEGIFKHKSSTINVVDLPGIYSLSPYSLEEVITKDFITKEKLDTVVNIVDASNIERNLLLSIQLLELQKPTVIALNMMDVAKQRGYTINLPKLIELLGVPVIPIVASKGDGVHELVDSALNNAKISDSKVLKKLFDDLEKLENITSDKEKLEELKTEKIYQVVDNIIEQSVERPHSENQSFTDKIDSLVTNKYIGIPIFAAIMFFTFYLTFDLVGNPLNELIDGFLVGSVAPFFESILISFGASDWLLSLVVDGIVSGVGGVLVFIPNIACLFLMISLMEDTGYMARVAFIMDRAMRSIGLSGKAFIPMILGLGCNVPAIMSARTLENPKDRLTTILINPFISCSARLPVYTLFAGAFFPGNEKYIVFSLYALGIAVAIIIGLIFKNTLFKADESPFIMELPPYRFPAPKNLFLHIWDRIKGFIIRAGTLIFGASIVLWFILNYNMSGVSAIDHSFGAKLGLIIAPIFAPLGFGTYQASLSLLTGVLAKEVVISNMAIIYGIGENAGEFASALANSFTPLSAYAFLVFVLLYTPCISVIGVIKRETGSLKWTIFSGVYQFAVAWFVAMLVFQIGSLII